MSCTLARVVFFLSVPFVRSRTTKGLSLTPPTLSPSEQRPHVHRYLDNDPQRSLLKYAREGDDTATPQFCAPGKIFAQKTLEQEHEERQKKVEKT